MKNRVGVALTVLLGLGSSPVQAVSIDWADAFQASGTVINPERVLGAPDHLAANVCPQDPFFCGLGPMGSPPVPPGSLAVSFTGSASTYGTEALAGLLGVSPGLLLAADVIAFDRNPNPMGGIGFENSLWHFDDGVATYDFSWTFGASAGGLVSAVGSVDKDLYAAFFGLTPLSFDAGFGFLLFDLDSVGLDADSDSFQVTISSDPNSTAPDPDAIGRLVSAPVPVPEPAGLGLLLGLGCLFALHRRARHLQ